MSPELPARFHLKRHALPTFVFLVALAPRLLGIGSFLTADEKNWVGRGVEFLRALREFRINDTLQTTHPGVTTLWIAGITSAVVSAVTNTPFSFDALRTFTLPTQVVMAFLHSALVAVLFLVLRRLFRPSVALLAGLVVALDPFLIGYSKLVHVDALLSSLTVLSLLLLIAGTEKQSREEAHGERPLLVWSAITGALAILSKVPALILIPMTAAILWGNPFIRTGEERRQQTRAFAQWLVIVILIVLSLWPGLLWVPDPIGNIKIVKRDLAVALSTPHGTGDAEGTTPWHYLRTIPTRTTVPTLLGLVVCVCLLIGRWGTKTSGREGAARNQTIPADDRRTVTWLFLFVALFLVGMMLGAKKGDRYLLPVFPAIDILAVWGGMSALQRLRVRAPGRVAAVLFLVPLVVELVRLGPYALAHYNILLPPNFSQEPGWGEGLDQVAAYLNGQKDNATAASWYPEELRAYARRPVLHLNASAQIPIGYVVLYRNMFGRTPDHYAHDFIERYYVQQTPVFTAVVNGLPYAWVYRLPVYQGLVGELIPGTLVLAQLRVAPGVLDGLEAYAATYSQRASRGRWLLRVRETPAGPDLRRVTHPVRAEDDNQWIRFSFEPFRLNAPRELFVLLTAEGTERRNAPTIRTAPAEKGSPPYWVGREGEPPSTLVRQPRAHGRLGIRPLHRSPE